MHKLVAFEISSCGSSVGSSLDSMLSGLMVGSIGDCPEWANTSEGDVKGDS